MKVRCIDADKCGNRDCLHIREHKPLKISKDAYCTDKSHCPAFWEEEVYCAEVVKEKLVLQPA